MNRRDLLKILGILTAEIFVPDTPVLDKRYWRNIVVNTWTYDPNHPRLVSVIMGERSDNTLFYAKAVVELGVSTNEMKAKLIECRAFLDTFLNCSCQIGEPCTEHKLPELEEINDNKLQ